MSDVQATTLSEHLLREAQKFTLYPKRAYRTKANLRLQETWDQARRKFVGWRKTFTPPEHAGLDVDFLTTPTFVDEVYCRDLLRDVPGFVERTLNLAKISLAGVANGESVVYLREAANCYIYGLPQAAIALARAAVEVHLRGKASQLLGRAVVAEMDLKDLIDDRRLAALFPSDAKKNAHDIRVAANRVLHEEPATSDDALRVVQAARFVLTAKR
jgi:hypothetical protein